MKEIIIITIFVVIQLFLSINLIVRKKVWLANISEIAFSLLMLYILNENTILLKENTWRYIIIIVACYILIKVFLILFFIIARYYSFHVIKKYSRNKRKHLSGRKLRAVKLFYKADYFPKLKLGLPGMAGKTHPVTKVRFDEKGFPKFKSVYTVKLQHKDYKKSREEHFYIANKKLYNNICSSSRLRMKFSSRDINVISQGDTPNKYTWHHHQDKGKLELVDREIHSKTSHIGGYSIWGGEK